MWQEYNPNPIQSRIVGDCSVRAISKALDVPWEKAYMMLCSNGFAMGDLPSSNATIASVLRQHGFYRDVIENECPDCYNFADFCKDNPEGVYVLGTGNHVATVVDGVLYDAWNSENEIPQYVFYKQEEEKK